MNEVIQQFWQAQPPLPGLVAWVVRFSNGALISGSFKESFAPTQIEQLMGMLVEGAQNLEQKGVQGLRFCWVFERARMHLAKRKDACCLGLLVEIQPEASPASADLILTAFEALRLKP